MDWVHWYAVIAVSLDLIIGAILHGQPKDDTDFRMVFFNNLLLLPLIGRVFGWW